MPCNAHNHDNARCNCGWGGAFYGNYSDEPEARWPASIGSGLEAWASLGTTVESFTIPNASCPVCRADVYFYRSPHNGRVYFDSLGPPWPKHECTDNSLRRVPVSPSWERAGWLPVVRMDPLGDRRSVRGFDATSLARIWMGTRGDVTVEWMMLLPFNWDGPVLAKPTDRKDEWMLEGVEIRPAKKAGGKPYAKKLRMIATEVRDT